MVSARSGNIPFSIWEVPPLEREVSVAIDTAAETCPGAQPWATRMECNKELPLTPLAQNTVYVWDCALVASLPQSSR